ncbi:esterase/lipase family protein [Brevibacillus laterosporus]|uniref:esterase/lipase family protein n=1 Tax=Brevibacillus laterosporus TaxID=1465 RepID=UPI000EB1F644|nr:alpha/beta fold hydrolase [Brevibacillus laterosporus]AYK06045.1 alpha/beta hydrolase [Brevibacillus laterosporus]
MQIHRIHKTPLIFIPGLFGSMSNEIIPGTGNWGFGISGAIYKPFIHVLESMGYQRNLTLFIAFYDWRQPIPCSAHTYLVQTIREAKQRTGASKVNLVCHSMGGLVARAYVQSNYYQDDVEQLIILCSPNAGSPVNYAYWTGGIIENRSESHINVVSIYMNLYLSYLQGMNPANPLRAIHTCFPSLLDCVPSRDYGDYLLEDDRGYSRFIPYRRMRVKNVFLDELNATQEIISKRNIAVTLIAGIGSSTIQNLQMVHGPLDKLGISKTILNPINSYVGDGIVMVHSVFALDGDKYMVKGGHMEVLFRSYSILQRKLA